VFATEHGDGPPAADPLLLTGVLFGQLGAEPEPKDFYRRLSSDAAYRRPVAWADLRPDEFDGLILPGGESTTQLQFLQEEGLYDAIKKFAAEDKAIFGTCAGAILLATEVKNPRQESLGLLDMTVLRNGYGRQVHSDVVSGPSTLKPEPMEMVFIRGPIFERVGPGIEVLAEYAGKPSLVQKGQILAAAFHPELTNDTTVHQRFLELAAESSNRSAVAR